MERAAAPETGVVAFPPDSPKLRQIKVEAVKEQSVPSEEVNSPGKVEANPNRLSRVLLPVTGRIMEVLVKIGDSVKAGDPLLSVESPDSDAALSAYLQAEAGITQAKAALAKAKADLDRVHDLYEHNAVAKKEVVNAEAVNTQAVAAVEQAQAGSKQALRRLEILGLKPGQFGQRVVVRAPLSGKVLELSVAPGEFRNDPNASLMTIADLSSVWVSADIPETQIRLVQVGERVDIELEAYPGEKFVGKVAQIADTVDPQTRTVKVRVEMANPRGRFRPEMFAKMRHVDGVTKKPVVPASAVVQGDGQNVVFQQLEPGRFRQTSVTLGSRVGDQVAVLSGLAPGDHVAVDGVMLLKSN